MHLIGKSVQVYALKPGGDTVHLVNIPDWDFHWQMYYRFQRPIYLPPGTKAVAVATYDNTTSNPNNPNNPPQTISVGEGTGDEMMLVYFNLTAQGVSPLDTNIVIDTASHWRHDSASCALVSGLDPALPEWAALTLWSYEPASRLLTVQGPPEGGFSYFLYDQQGRVLTQGCVPAGQSTVQTPLALSQGTVMVGCLTDERGRSYYRKWATAWR
jgi:hypothetical protein